MFLILSAGLIQVDEIVTFSLEQEDWIHHTTPVDFQTSRANLAELAHTDSHYGTEKVQRPGWGATGFENTNLHILRRRGAM